MRVNPVNNQKFRGIPIADVSILNKNVPNKIKLYKLSSKDKEFLDNLYLTIDVKKLMPGMSDIKYDIWDEIIYYGLKSLTYTNRKGILEVQNGIPCGIINYKSEKDKWYVNYIATWPIKTGEKTPFAGKILFKEFFEQFLKSSANGVELNALKFAPFNCVSKYLELGFKQLRKSTYQEAMGITREDVSKTLQKFDENISSVKIKNGKNENLCKFLNLENVQKLIRKTEQDVQIYCDY